jgi:hydroxylaminobenzene mutase
MNTEFVLEYGRKLVRNGILLFLIGLLTGFVIPVMQNPRMGLSSHLEGVQNGMLLILLGLVLPKLNVKDRAIKWSYGLAIFGTFTNWFTTFLAGFWGAGAEMMPIAGGNFIGAAWQEGLIKVGLLSLSISMLAVSVIYLWGLRGRPTESQLA